MAYIAKNYDKEIRFYSDEVEKARKYWNIEEKCDSLNDVASFWNEEHASDGEGELIVYGK